MSELKIIETVGNSPNTEFGKWYEEKVRETAKFLVRKIPVEHKQFVPHANLEEITTR